MQFFKPTDANSVNSVQDAVASIDLALNAGNAALSNKNSVLSMISGESFEQEHESSITAVQAAINTSGLKGILMSRCGTEDENDPRVIAGLNAASMVLAGSGDPEAYFKATVATSNVSQGADTVCKHNVPGVEVLHSLSGESFEGAKYGDYLAISTVISALATSVNSFEETFFPTVILAPGKSGIDLKVKRAYAYSLSNRSGNGEAYKEQAARKPLINALLDNTILQSLANQVIPFAETANDGVLVAAADVPDRAVTVSGQTFNTRPLVFGKTIDLLDVSAHPSLEGNGVQNQTDVLAQQVNLGKVYIKLVKGGDERVVEFDVSRLPGSNFTNQSEGSITTQTINFGGIVQLNQDTQSVTSESMDVLDFRTSGGVAGADAYHTNIMLEISGSIDEMGNIRLFANGVKFDAFYNVEAEVDAATLGTVSTDIALELVGFVPKAARTNANLRERGTIIDAGTPQVYRIPVYPGSPLTAISPIGKNGEIELDGLANAKRIRNSNNAVLTLLDFESTISNTTQLPQDNTTVGSLLVNPTYVKSSIDLLTDLRIHSSKNGMDDLRIGLTNALSIMADQLAVESGYLSALEMETGSSENYEVILGTDPHLSNLIMTSGDARSMGSAKRFKISYSHDTDLSGRIYMSFRRTDKQGADALSFGVHAELPPLVYNAPINSQGAHFANLQLIPRSTHAVTLPILARMDVTNLDSVFIDG